MKNLLKFCSLTESATGLALISIPSIVLQLLFGEEVYGLALTISRFAGICLISFGIACWPSEQFIQALRSMSIYNLLVAFFFIYIGLNSSLVGILLWPVATIHFVLSVLLIRELQLQKRKSV